MSEDPLEFLRKTTAADNESRLQQQIQANSQAQIRSRNVRRFLRYALIGLPVTGFALAYFGGDDAIVQGTAAICFLLMLPAAGVLFFMGGFAGFWTRRMLSKRERELLDD